MTVVNGAGGAETGLVETPNFRVLGACVEARTPRRLDNDLADAIVSELAPLGLVPDLDAFERIFTRTVENSAPTPGLAWNSFYRNTLARLRGGDRKQADGSVATFGRIYADIARLVEGRTVLDVGSCFGFLPLLLAERLMGALVVGCDLSAAAVALADRVARSLRSRAAFVVADAGRLPFRDRAMDTVTLVHLLEHLSPAQGRRVLCEALRVADRRVLVAVPVEAMPNPAFGHVRTFRVADLAALGAAVGAATVSRHRAWESDGAWLQLDRRAG